MNFETGWNCWWNLFFKIIDSFLFCSFWNHALKFYSERKSKT